MIAGGNESPKMMTKSATGNPLIVASHQPPILNINALNSSSISQQQQQPPSGLGTAAAAFPRNTRNRQTFHGKTEHNKVCG
jgi:hypothetical protein